MRMIVASLTGTCISSVGENTHVFLVNGVGEDNFEELDRMFQKIGSDVHMTGWDSLNNNGDGPFHSNEQLIRDMANIIDSYVPSDHVILVGHSYGGDSVLKVANATTHRIDLLATLDPVGMGGFRSSFGKNGTITGGIIGFSTGGLIGGVFGSLIGGGTSNAAGAVGLTSADNLPTVPANVNYFYNRWQEREPFPVDFLTSGLIESHARYSLSNDMGVADQTQVLEGHMQVPNDVNIQNDLFQTVIRIASIPAMSQVEKRAKWCDIWLNGGWTTLRNQRDQRQCHRQ